MTVDREPAADRISLGAPLSLVELHRECRGRDQLAGAADVVAERIQDECADGREADGNRPGAGEFVCVVRERRVERACRVWNAERGASGKVGDWIWGGMASCRSRKTAEQCSRWQSWTVTAMLPRTRTRRRRWRRHRRSAMAVSRRGSRRTETQIAGRRTWCNWRRRSPPTGIGELWTVLVRLDMPLPESDRQQRTGGAAGTDECVQLRREYAGREEWDDGADAARVRDLYRLVELRTDSDGTTTRRMAPTCGADALADNERFSAGIEFLSFRGRCDGASARHSN